MRGGGEGEGSQRRGEFKEFWFKVTVDAAAEYVEIVIRLEFILRIRVESSRAFPPAPPHLFASYPILRVEGEENPGASQWNAR